MLEWLMQNVDPDVWEKEYKEIFFGDPKLHEMRQASKARLAPAQRGQEGGLNIQRKEPPKPAPDLSQLTGRAGGTGKADPNKASKRAIKSALTIAPGDDGDLSVTTDDTPSG